MAVILMPMQALTDRQMNRHNAMCNTASWRQDGIIRNYVIDRDQAKVIDKAILEKVALDGSVECYAPPPRWCDLEL